MLVETGRYAMTMFATMVSVLTGVSVTLPTVFDATQGAAACRVHHIVYQQGGCGACLAFATSTVLAYRSCIHSGHDYVPSPYRIFDCLSSGCDHGLSITKVDTASIRGIGDLNGTPPVFGWGCKYGAEPMLSGWVGYSSTGALSMKADIFYHGPAVANIYVDPLFYGYRGRPDVYNLRHVDAIPEEYVDSLHAVVITGWGTDPEPHWVLQNSWGPYWGNGGFVKVPLHSITTQYAWRYDPYGMSDELVVGVWGVATLVSIVALVLQSKFLWLELRRK